jgi:hypothetical protein
MISPFHEFIRFPRRLSPFPRFSAAIADVWKSNPANFTQYETITMRRQMWAIEGEVKGTRIFYTDPETKFNVIEGFRCERCNRTFFASELNDFSHECMEPAN